MKSGCFCVISLENVFPIFGRCIPHPYWGTCIKSTECCKKLLTPFKELHLSLWLISLVQCKFGCYLIMHLDQVCTTFQWDCSFTGLDESAWCGHQTVFRELFCSWQGSVGASNEQCAVCPEDPPAPPSLHHWPVFSYLTSLLCPYHYTSSCVIQIAGIGHWGSCQRAYDSLFRHGECKTLRLALTRKLSTLHPVLSGPQVGYWFYCCRCLC